MYSVVDKMVVECFNRVIVLGSENGVSVAWQCPFLVHLVWSRSLTFWLI